MRAPNSGAASQYQPRQTMTRTKKATSVMTLEQVLLGHFDAHQKSTNDDSSQMSVERRAGLIREELSSFVLSEGVQGLSLDSDDGKASEVPASLVERVQVVILQCIDSAMAATASSSSEPIEKILDLAAYLSCAAGNGLIAKTVLDRTLAFTTVILERVRAQACTFLGICVHYLLLTDGPTSKKSSRLHPDELAFMFDNTDKTIEWKEDAAEFIKQGLLPRLTDKSQAVRYAAICASKFALAGFESVVDQDEERDYFLDALLWNLTHDPSVSNRVAVVQSVPIMGSTIDHVIDRVRDVKVKVRVAALDVLRTKAVATELSNEQCAELVRSGLSDRCKTTCEAATKTICAGWMKAVKYDPIALLGLVGPILYESECTKVTRVLLDVASIEAPDVLDELSDAEIRAFRSGVTNASVVLDQQGDELTPEAILFARVKCDWTKLSTSLSSTRKADAIARIIPDVPFLCETLDKHVAKLGQMAGSDHTEEPLEEREIFICSQLLQLTQATDLSEEGSRRFFITTVKRMLSAVDTHEELIEAFVGAMKAAHEREVDFLHSVNEILLAIVAVDQHQEVLPSAVRLRIICILASVLENVSPGMAADPVLGEFVRHVVPAVTSSTSTVREIGVGCMGRLALLSSQDMVLEEFKPLLFRVAANDDEKVEIRAQAMLAICDLAFVFADMLEPCVLTAEGDASSTEISFKALIVDLLDNGEGGMVLIAAEVAAKLHFVGRLQDPNIIAQLVLAFFGEQTNDGEQDILDEDDAKEVGSPHRMQQLLSLFFPAYSVKSQEGRETLTASVAFLLSIVDEKLQERGTKVSHFPVAKMIEYIGSVLDIGLEKGVHAPTATQDFEKKSSVAASRTDMHTSGALLVSIEIVKFLIAENTTLPAPYLRALCKLLGSTDVVGFGGDNDAAEFKKGVEELQMLVDDTISLRSLEKVAQLLASSDGDNTTGEDLDESRESQDSLTDALKAIHLVQSKENNGEVESSGVTVPMDKEITGRSSRSRSHLAAINS